MDSADDFVDEGVPERIDTSQRQESRPSSSSVAVDCVSEEEPTPTLSAIPDDGPRGEDLGGKGGFLAKIKNSQYILTMIV